MRQLFIVSLLLLNLIFAFAASAQDDVAADELFALVSDMPVIENSASPREWAGRYTDPGAMIYHDGLFHMFRNGFLGWPASVQIGYMTSEDGLNWTQVSDGPVLFTDDVPYAEVAALASGIVAEDDGSWSLYFYTWEDYTRSPAGRIGRATAPEPTGPWTVDAEPVLQPGAEGSWDSRQVMAPRVFRTDDGYIMYYVGYDDSPTTSGGIGIATSDDGITWTKYDDPATTDAPLAESDPVVVPQIEGDYLTATNIAPAGDGWVMLYRQQQTTDPRMYLMHSDDMIHWEYVFEEPVWSRANMPANGPIWYTGLIHHDDTYYLYVESAHKGGSSIFAATHDGPLPGDL